MLNFSTFVYQLFHWRCCVRTSLGGGAGIIFPSKIYAESGVVFMCVMLMTPISPLLAPAALLHFLFCAPLWRRNCIYMYRSTFDSGGIKWPILSDIFISSMYASQILLGATMLLKQAFLPAILTFLSVIPIYLHRKAVMKKYYRQYKDLALLQTSDLDIYSREQREDYRKFLVDAHKAAYVPICLAGETASGLTFEPADVIDYVNDPLRPIPTPQNDSNEGRLGLGLQQGSGLNENDSPSGVRRRRLDTTQHDA